MDVRDSVLVTGAYGLVGRPVVERLVADGYKVIATAHRRDETVAACLRGRALGRSDQAGSGHRVARRCIADGHRSPGGVHPADVLRQPCAGACGERRRDRVAGARRGGDAVAASLRARVEHGGVRQPQPAPVHRPAHPRNPAVGVGAVRLSQARGRKHRALIGFGMVDPSARRRHHPRTAGRLRGLRLVLLRLRSLPEDNRCHSVDSRDVAAAFAAAVTTDACGRSS